MLPSTMAVETIALGAALARAVVSLLLRHVLALAADLARVLGPPQAVRRLRVRDGAMGAAEFEERVLRPGVPVLLEGFDLGMAPSLWSSPEALMELCGDKLVSVHASAEADLEWLQKNFEFAVMPFSELIRRVWPAAAIPAADAPPALSTEPRAPSPAGAARFFYLRSVGEKMRTQPADFGRSFPRLAETIVLPAPYPAAAFFSSALRVGSAGLSLWTHNDVMENLLVHVVGHKRVTLWPPSCARELGVRGSASDCGAAEHAKWATRPALALCRARARTAQLRPGDVLYIPPLWYHHVSSLTASVSVNVFWRGLPQDRWGARCEQARLRNGRLLHARSVARSRISAPPSTLRSR